MSEARSSCPEERYEVCVVHTRSRMNDKVDGHGVRKRSIDEWWDFTVCTNKKKKENETYKEKYCV